MERVIDLLKVFASILIIALSASILFGTISRITAISGGVETVISELTQEADKSQLGMIDGNQFSGSTVVQYVGEYNQLYPIQIFTNTKPEGFFSSEGIYDYSSEYYVAPNKQFYGKLIRNDNDAIIALMFVQTEITPFPEFDYSRVSEISEAILLDRQIATAQYKIDDIFYELKPVYESLESLREDTQKLQDQYEVQIAENAFALYREKMSLENEQVSNQLLTQQIQEARQRLANAIVLYEEYEALLAIGDVEQYPMWKDGEKSDIFE